MKNKNKNQNKKEWGFKNGEPAFKSKTVIGKLLAAAIFSCCMFVLGSAKAQTSVKLTYLTDSTYYASCSNNNYHNFDFGGSTTGYSPNNVMTANINFGDGKDTTVICKIWSGFRGWVSHRYSSSGSFNVRVIAVGDDGKSDTLIKNNLVLISDSCGNVKGKVYVDTNGNCQFDSGEGVLQNTMIRVFSISSGSFIGYSFTDSIGNYSFDVALGSTYEIQLGNTVSYPVSCPVSGKYTVSAFPSAGNDFGINCSGSAFDLGFKLSAWGFRPGGNGYINFCLNAVTCNPKSGKIKIVIPSKITPISEVYGKVFTTSGDTVIFNFSNVSYWQGQCYSLKVSTSTSATISDSICLWAVIEAGPGDTNPLNNISTGCWPVRNSWDPNDKQVGAPGMKANGDISTKATELNYTVNFQNTGNDVAYDIFVMDTLAANLDISTLKINASSHSMVVNIFNNNVLRFKFDNIMLPDNKANEPKSHGFVNYSIKTKDGLTVGSKIKNTAHIYFDFNPAIITNTTLNTVNVNSATAISEGNLNENEIRVFPNPFSGSTNIIYTLNQKSYVILEVFNVMGEKVAEIENASIQAGTHRFQLNAFGLNSGIYLLKMNVDGQISTTRMVLEK